ncbi:MAG: galactokinase [Clostridia bacterium]|nr:galactokinase [Clostridia bacterium]
MNFTALYGNFCNKREIERRYASLEEKCRAAGPSTAFYSSPGRAEILGNHTDHQAGEVIVSALSCDIVAGVAKRDDGVVEICSAGFSPIRFSVKDTTPKDGEKGRSASIAKGIVAALRAKGYEVGGFSAYTDSTVFRGAGVSSSAAFEVLVAEICNDLYLGGRLSKTEKAVVAQFAENEYFGKPCGLLDPCGVSYGGLNRIDFKHPESPVVERLALPKGYALVLVNTGGSHSGLTEYYASIKEEMSEVARFFSKKTLREVPYFLFLDRVNRLREKFGERAVLRALHYFDENRRVDLAAKALKEGNVSCFLEQVSRSGRSSVAYLQNAFVPGSTVQPILLALALSERIVKDGAVRLHGGGFAGTILAVLKEEETAKYLSEMKKVFGDKNVFLARLRSLGACRVK